MAEPLIYGLLEQLFSIIELNPEGLVKLKDVEADVEKLSCNLAAVQAVLVNAEQIQFFDESVREWVNKVQDLCYEADGVFDEWRTAILKSQIEKGQIGLSNSHKVPSSCFLPFNKSHRIVIRPHDIARKIKELSEQLDQIASDKERYEYVFNNIREFEQDRPKSTSSIDVSEVYGRDKEKESLISKLVSESSEAKIGLDIIPIVGMAGIGKTTLAQLVYNDDRVKKEYGCRIWMCVGDSFDFVHIAKGIVDAIGGSVPNSLDMESLLTSIHESICGKKFLLVLDDVLTDDVMQWDRLEGSLKHGAAGSRVLVTTRNEKVAFMMRAETHMIRLQHLSDAYGWRIFSNLAFRNRESRRRKMEEIGRRIVHKCGGLPLLAKTLGGLMFSKRTTKEWADVLHGELCQLEQVWHQLSAPFFSSYFNLPLLEKRCLLYCAIFAKDSRWIDRDDLIELWMSQGYLNGSKIFEKGENCFDSLILRSFFEKEFHGNDTAYKLWPSSLVKEFHGNDDEVYKMHVIVHEFLRFVSRDKGFETWDGSSPNEGTHRRDETTRHLTLLQSSGAQIPSSIYNKKKLRTLFVTRSARTSDSEGTSLNLDLIPELTCLRTLYLRKCGIWKLPAKIDKLMYLRYLNLSDNLSFMELSNEVCNLINLQTLKLNSCVKLESLPDGMGKLVNLRHLYIDGCDRLKELPKGIGRLASLEILDMFVVPRDNLIKNNKVMELGDLNRLKHVIGHLYIRGIENVIAAGDAVKAQLKEKQKLVGLKLDFRGQELRKPEEVTVLLEALQPHPNLQYLLITRFSGQILSSSWVLSLIHLRRLVLSYSFLLVELPPFGKLPSLESLHIVQLRRVKKVGPEFLGIMESTDESSFVSFPKLKQLTFDHLERWEEWFGRASSSVTIMPCLRSLRISHCNCLQTLPYFLAKIPIQDLDIRRCPILKEPLEKRVVQEWCKISHIPKIQIDYIVVRTGTGAEEPEVSQTDEISLRESAESRKRRIRKPVESKEQVMEPNKNQSKINFSWPQNIHFKIFSTNFAEKFLSAGCIDQPYFSLCPLLDSHIGLFTHFIKEIMHFAEANTCLELSI